MSRGAKIALYSVAGVVAVLVLGVALLLNFDWNRAKPWISSHVSTATGRAFAINGKLALTWHAPQGEQGWRGWVPWPRLAAHDVVFGNPDWAHDPVMARAREVTFSISPLPLLNKKIVIPSLALDAPELSLQRLDDGRNNWTFGSKGGQSKWQFELQRLILNKGTIRLQDAIKHAKLKADINTLDDGGKENYRLGWRVAGTYNDEEVSGQGRAGGVLSLQKQNLQYPVDASVRIGKTSIDAKGTLTDPRQLVALDLQLKIASVSMAQLYPIIGVVLPETRPFMTEGRLHGSPGPHGGNWVYENFTGKMGASDLSGSLHYRGREGRHEERPLLEGTVASSFLNFNDLSPLIGADSAASRKERGSKTVQPPDKVLPVESFRAERWNSIDADVQFSGRKIVRKEELPIDDLVTRIHLRDGVISLAPLKFGIAGGNLVSNITLNGKSKPVKAELKLSARHMKLRQLFPVLQSQQAATLGEINGDAALTASGNSIAELLATSDGEIKAVINQGTMSKLLLEKMGLNIGSIIVTQMFGDKPVQINCAATDFVVNKGIMHAQAFVVDTADATIHVTGNINLAKEQLAMMIYPDTKGVRLISLRSPLHLDGTFKKPKVGIDKGTVALKAGSAIALGALAPVAAALIPLVNVGPGEKSECGMLLAQATAKPVAPTASRKSENTSGK
ncbi:MAG TPA: AsmA family protein [Noviherbaspirillum sp.]|uniref:AsmA family protein n=1 Tax=Noviherbaspirillum sp. TaxID=1926288 RepID=UPI002B476C84|nr:AsmA family protein [Noviherbaspirillum sp.]HJV86666.1 AsmA family protein [Noviherbaspirillum sp.]